MVGVIMKGEMIDITNPEHVMQEILAGNEDYGQMIEIYNDYFRKNQDDPTAAEIYDRWVAQADVWKEAHG